MFETMILAMATLWMSPEGDWKYAVGTAVAVAVVTLLWVFRWRARASKLPILVPTSHAELLAAVHHGTFHVLLKDLMTQYGPVFRVRWTAGSTFTVVGEPRLLRTILEDKATSDKTAENVSILRRVTNGNPNILSRKTADEAYVVSRKGLAGSFSRTNLYATLPALEHKLQEFVAILDDHVGRGATLQDLPSWFTRLTIDLISTSMFSSDFHTLGDDRDGVAPSRGHVYLERFPLVLLEFGVRNAGRFLRPLMFWLPAARQASESAQAIHDVGQAIVDEYRAEHPPTSPTAEHDQTILGHLMRTKYRNDAERVADLSMLMFAGHDTTANQLALIMVELSRNPQVVAKMRAELDATFDGSPGPSAATPQQLSQLSYVRLVIKEGQRLWPVVATGPARVLLRDVDCGGGMTLPKGMEVRAAFFAMFRPSIDRPDEFVPDRWLPGDQNEAALKELFMPFSLGIRTCIGQNLALLEMTLVLATLYYSYDYELVGLAGEEAVVKEELFVTLKPKGAHFAVRKRVAVPPSTVESKHGDEE